MAELDNPNVKIAAGLNARGRSRGQAAAGSQGTTVGDNSGTGVNTNRRKKTKVVGTPGGTRLGAAHRNDPNVQARESLNRIDLARRRNSISDRAAFEASADVNKNLTANRAVAAKEAENVLTGQSDANTADLQRQELGRGLASDALAQQNVLDDREIARHSAEESSRVDAEGRRLDEKKFTLDGLKAILENPDVSDDDRAAFDKAFQGLIPSTVPALGESAEGAFTESDAASLSSDQVRKLLDPNQDFNSKLGGGGGSSNPASTPPADPAVTAPTSPVPVVEKGSVQAANELTALKAEYSRASGRRKQQLGQQIKKREGASVQQQAQVSGLQAQVAAETDPQQKRLLQFKLKRLQDSLL